MLTNGENNARIKARLELRREFSESNQNQYPPGTLHRGNPNAVMDYATWLENKFITMYLEGGN